LTDDILIVVFFVSVAVFLSNMVDVLFQFWFSSSFDLKLVKCLVVMSVVFLATQEESLARGADIT